MTLKFKNRIALFNTLAVAIITAVVFIVVYSVVYNTAYAHLDGNLSFERSEVFGNLNWSGDSIIINKMPEWDEEEHSQIEVNPTFLQISDISDKIIFKSDNLINDQKLELRNTQGEVYFNGEINDKLIRLGQFPILNGDDKVIGKLIVAISQQESKTILNNLIWVLLISFPLVLIIQFLASSLAASKAIEPVHQLISSASVINESNLSSRLDLPKNKDELFELTSTINELLTRIETSMIQQKQFTSDASHEIRTPLSAIRGTLEVLIRKPRESKIYESKISDVIVQVDRLGDLLEQLLLLARIDSKKASIHTELFQLSELCDGLYKKWLPVASVKQINLHINVPEDLCVNADRLYLEIILDNLVSNAIKYGKEAGNVHLSWDSETKALEVKDDGIGILPENISNIFDRFYRADESRSSAVKGNGLGLSIVKKLADLQHISLGASSINGHGSIFTLQFTL